MCISCLRSEYDITDGIPKSAALQFCRNCERYLQPPANWVAAQLESRELLALCLKRLKGLSKVRLIDASFVWTEPHSRRIRVKLTIQKEVHISTILQQAFEVEYIVNRQQCPDCARVMAQNTWQAVVQVRQKVSHKRTFLYLEQLILKHNIHKDTTNIKEIKDGLDFFYGQRAHGVKMVEFLQAVAPVRIKTSEQLISSDVHSNTSTYKFSYSAEIVPICKDDLICLPQKVAHSLGNINPLVLCYRVGNSVHVMDPNTLAVTDVPTPVYWRTPFSALATSKDLVEYYVLNVEPLGPIRGKFILADVHVARSSDFGKNDTTFFTRSHLGGILNPGDAVMGYDLTSANFNDENFDRLELSAVADAVLVKKAYPARRKKNRTRHWKLKSLSKERDESSSLSRGRQQDAQRGDHDYELFLRELEEDPELRQSVNLYRAGATASRAPRMEVDGESETDEADTDFPDVRLEELLEDLTIEDDAVGEAIQ